MSDEIQTPDTGSAPSPEPAPSASWEDTLVKTADAIEAREPVRGENGQFQPKVVADKAPAAAEVPGSVQAAPPDPAPPVIEAPQSLPADVKAEWAKLPPQVQKYWAEREGEIHKKFTTDGQRIKDYEGVDSALELAKDFLEQNRIPKTEYIRRLAQADHLLRSDPRTGIAQIAQMYPGVLAALQTPGAQPDPNSALAKTVNQLQEQVKSLSTASETAKLAAAQESINAFKKDRPHFDAVENLMSELMETGAAAKVPGDAPLLEKAYNLAITLDPAVKAAIAKDEADKAAKKAAEEAKEKASKDAKIAPFAQRPGSAQTAPVKGKTWEDTLKRVGDEVYARS